jgi:heavy metal sensor kinase
MSVRLRVTLAFAVVMALLLAGLGVFVYERFRSDLDDSIAEGLRSRAEQVSRQVKQPPPAAAGPQAALVQREESFAQVISPDGKVIETGGGLGATAILSRSDLARAARGEIFVEHGGRPLVNSSVRVLARPVETPSGKVIVAAGIGLDDRHDTLASLRGILLVGGAGALLLASLAGYAATALALRPVEAMRRRAAAISAAEPDERLPVSSADDELSRLGKTLNDMLERLEATLARERQFVDDASHELRTPLAMQKTELELALRYGDDPEELRAALRSAIGEVDRLIRLAEDLLVLARSEKCELALRREPLQLAALFADVGKRFRRRAGGDGRSLVVDAPDGLTADADRARLEQALTNLLDNALRHGAGEVRLFAARDGEDLEIHVTDEGAGFPPEYLPRAFERFSRADPARAGGGSGLGLAIVAAVARSHGGSAGAENRPGGGADVWISLHGDFIGPP